MPLICHIYHKNCFNLWTSRAPPPIWEFVFWLLSKNKIIIYPWDPLLDKQSHWNSIAPRWIICCMLNDARVSPFRVHICVRLCVALYGPAAMQNGCLNESQGVCMHIRIVDGGSSRSQANIAKSLTYGLSWSVRIWAVYSHYTLRQIHA